MIEMCHHELNTTNVRNNSRFELESRTNQNPQIPDQFHTFEKYREMLQNVDPKNPFFGIILPAKMLENHPNFAKVFRFRLRGPCPLEVPRSLVLSQGAAQKRKYFHFSKIYIIFVNIDVQTLEPRASCSAGPN